MAEIIIMPKLGFNMNEGKLVEWYKKEGDAVAKGEPLFSVETDKTNMDIEATGDGVVKKLLIEAGDTIPVTLPIAVIGAAEEDASAAIEDAASQLKAGGADITAQEQRTDGSSRSLRMIHWPGQAGGLQYGRHFISRRSRHRRKRNPPAVLRCLRS